MHCASCKKDQRSEYTYSSCLKLSNYLIPASGSTVLDIAMQDILDKDLYFCGMVCLKDWVLDLIEEGQNSPVTLEDMVDLIKSCSGISEELMGNIYREDQNCFFCLNPESILSKEACCTGCSIFKKN